MKEACPTPNYSKGGEAEWEFQVYNVALMIGIVYNIVEQCV